MTFVDWMNINMIIDISFIVFLFAFLWKFRKINKKTKEIENNIVLINNKIKEIENNIVLVARNPRLARKKLKK